MNNVMKKIARMCLNYCFRGNNLLIAQVKSFCKHNTIRVDGSSNLRNVKFLLAGSDNFVKIGKHCSLSGVVIYMNSDHNRLIIGDHVKVNATTKMPTRFNACDGCSIEVDDDCLFSNSIEVHTTDYHKIYVKNHYCNSPENVHIGKHSWVGLRTLILKGVTLAPNTIVGANSVVATSCDEANTIIAGSPARVIKREVEWSA